jgi:HEAT repeat protein
MEREKLEALLIDYIDGNLSPADKAIVNQLLIENNDAQQLHKELKEVMDLMDRSMTLEVLHGNETTFASNLKAELDIKEDVKVVRFQPAILRVAAAIALVAIGVAGGFWINRNYQHEQELAALRKEMMETKQLMMAMLTNGQSASKRMQGVTVAMTISTADDEVVKALADALTHDSNTNVRLAALEALSQFIDEPQVRRIIISSLSTQDDPMVQIALIQLLVKLKEKNVVNELEKIINDDKNIQAVKDEAYTGIIKLS